MGNRFLLISCILVISIGTVVVEFPNGVVAIGLVFALSAVAITFFRKYTEEKEFLTTVFLGGLALRMAFGVYVHVFDLRAFFGGDALGYDYVANGLSEYWQGRGELEGMVRAQTDLRGGTAWGMYYLIGSLYFVIGRNIFAAQSLCAVIGAATAPMIFYCSKKIFNNTSTAKIAAIGIAAMPAFIIWTGQLLKDGLIIFLLVTAMTMVLQLQEKLSFAALLLLIISLFGIISIRFYIFYMVLVAVVGSFLVGLSTTRRSIMRTTIVLLVAGAALIYLGVGQTAQNQLQVFANLERIQVSRLDLARSAESGFGEQLDVSTTGGALWVLPTGFAYLYLAPFPWQAASLRQAITIPDVLIWWSMLPFLISGLIYTIRKRLRNAFPVLIFSLMLTMAYSVFQGNVGTAYRQRTQIQAFLFILIAVGWTVFREERENRRIIRTEGQKRVDHQLRQGGRGAVAHPLAEK